MNQPEEIHDTEPCLLPPPEDTDILCSSCAAKLVFDELALEVLHPEPPCDDWRHQHAAGLQRGAIK